MIVINILFYLSFYLLFIVFFRIFIIRNNEVYEESMRILNIINGLSQRDIRNDKEWKWRYEEFEKISQSKMIFKFWIPVKDFFKNNRAIKE